MRICNFTYNGYCGKTFDGYPRYSVQFIKWTNDPGIGLFECSDGKERLIPTFAIIDYDRTKLPVQDYGGDRNNMIVHGTPCHS